MGLLCVPSVRVCIGDRSSLGQSQAVRCFHCSASSFEAIGSVAVASDMELKLNPFEEQWNSDHCQRGPGVKNSHGKSMNLENTQNTLKEIVCCSLLYQRPPPLRSLR